MMNIFIGFEDKIEDCKNFLFNYKKKKISVSKFLNFSRLKNFNLHYTLGKRKIELSKIILKNLRIFEGIITSSWKIF